MTLPILLLVACYPTGLMVPKDPGDTGPATDTTDTGDTPADTGDTEDTPVDTGDTGDTPVDTGETGDTGETQPPENTMEFWRGTETYSTDGWMGACTDTVNVEGRTIESTNPDLPDLQAACPTCTHFYRLKLDPRNICDDWVWLDEEVVRGIRVTTDLTLVYEFQEDWGSWSADLLDESGILDDTTLTYGFSWEIFWDQYMNVSATAELTSE